jgi:RNA polymerase sigma-70 factor (ECF subfamily)
MRRYRKTVYYLILKMIRNQEDAEDLTQEAFAKAFASLNSFDPKFAFSTWVCRIASNTSIDFIRRKKLQTMSIHQNNKNDEGESVVFQIKDEGLNPDEHYHKEQRRKYLQMAVENLPERYQRLVRLRYFEEYSYEEVAEELEIPLGTVKAQLHRARELLNEQLSQMQSNL